MGKKGRACRSTVECFPSMYWYLGSVFSTTTCKGRAKEGIDRRQNDGRTRCSLWSSPKDMCLQSGHENNVRLILGKIILHIS